MCIVWYVTVDLVPPFLNRRRNKPMKYLTLKMDMSAPRYPGLQRMGMGRWAWDDCEAARTVSGHLSGLQVQAIELKALSLIGATSKIYEDCSKSKKFNVYFSQIVTFYALTTGFVSLDLLLF